jgi:hypothetical protein
MRHARDADARWHHDISFYIRYLTGMIPDGDLTDPDAATVPNWHTTRHLSEKKGIFAADPIWNVRFHACGDNGETVC